METLSKQEKIDKHDERIQYNFMLQSKEKLKQGRIIFLIIAGLQIFGVFGGLSSNLMPLVVIHGTIMVTFIVLAVLVTKTPKKAVVIGLSLYIILELIGFLLIQSIGLTGLILKVIIISGLIKAYTASKDVVEIQRKMDEINERKKMREA